MATQFQLLTSLNGTQETSVRWVARAAWGVQKLQEKRISQIQILAAGTENFASLAAKMLTQKMSTWRCNQMRCQTIVSLQLRTTLDRRILSGKSYGSQMYHKLWTLQSKTSIALRKQMRFYVTLLERPKIRWTLPLDLFYLRTDSHRLSSTQIAVQAPMTSAWSKATNKVAPATITLPLQLESL